MVKVKELTIEVIYRVGYGDVEMPENVYKQLVEASEKGHKLEMGSSERYTEALDWLSNNIQEADAMDWQADIEEISELNEEDEA